ncbi:MAG: S8 family serine peptidase, partial [Rubrivivax sp.]
MTARKERPETAATGLRTALAALMALAASAAAQASALPATSLQQRTNPAQAKIAADLRSALVARALVANHVWARDLPPAAGSPAGTPTTRYVKALVFCECADPTMAELRQAVLRAGGSVYMGYLTVRGLSVLLPAAGVLELARRPEVQSLSPNRLTSRSSNNSIFSDLEWSTNIAPFDMGGGVRGMAVTERPNTSTGVLVTPAATAVNNTPPARPHGGRTGAGVGIAILDSGIMLQHANFRADNGATRVTAAGDFTAAGDAGAAGAEDWKPGFDASVDLLTPGSALRNAYEARLRTIMLRPDGVSDGYGHGTHVASVAAGRAWNQAPNSTGVAPDAQLYDFKVLDRNGFGTVSSVLAAIDWVVMNARRHNIRVMNLSLSADSTESYVTDPLCRAVRSATAMGITVVVAAGNYGSQPGANGKTVEVYGTVGSPGIEPSVITVGSANTMGTATRTDDTVNRFSSRGPTRGLYTTPTGQRRPDNSLKPDLVAPGNRILGAMATPAGTRGRSELPARNPSLVPPLVTGGSATNFADPTAAVMTLSGTSIAAPVVAGTVALMLEANPGLTPPLIKAMLQYSAEPLAGFNLLQQGAGLLNPPGALQLAEAVRQGLMQDVEAGAIQPGASLLASGKAVPTYLRVGNSSVPMPRCPRNQPCPLPPLDANALTGGTGRWSQIVYAGGNRILSGEALFNRYHLAWDHRVSWGGTVGPRRTQVGWWSGLATVANGGANIPRSFSESPIPELRTTLFQPGVLFAPGLAGTSSL